MSNKVKGNTIKASKKQSQKVVLAKEKGKNKSSKKEKIKSQSKHKTQNSGSFLSFFKKEQVRIVFGLCLLIFTLFLFVAFLSFLFTHEADDDIFSSNLIETLSTTKTANNHLGLLGVYFSFLFIKIGFGIASFGLLLLTFIYSIHLIARKKILPLFKTTVWTFAIILWVSTLLAFIFRTSVVWLGGGLGNEIVELLTTKIGSMGIVLLLLLYLLCLIVLLGGLTMFSKSNKKEEISDNQENIDITPKTILEEEKEKTEQQSQKTKNFKIFSIFKSKKDEQKENTENSQDEEFDIEQNIKQEDLNINPINDIVESSQTIQTETLSENHFFEQDQNIAGEDVLLEDVAEDSTQNTDINIIEKNVEIPGEDILIDETLNDNQNLEIEEEHQENTQSIETDSSTFSNEEMENGEILLQNLPPYDPHADLLNYKYPTVDLLEEYANEVRTKEQKLTEIATNKQRIKETLSNYGIEISSISATEGPTITMYEIVPAPGIRIAKIKGLEDDIALSLAALGIRIIAPIPGKGTIGIEVPNTHPQIVPMKDVILSEKFQNSEKMALPVAIGKTISNEVFVFDLAKMPHVLMAGATGQGKSVGLNAILASLLYKKHPSELKFVLVDPKKVELTLYSKIERHYLAKLPDLEEPIITDTHKVVKTLTSLCNEMDQRYELLKIAQCRNIIEYNEKFKSRKLNPEKGHRFLPYIVLVFDEFADCIMTAGREVETPIARLAQLARAIGIHLIIATQRPSVNIITGVIKANFPARIAFRVSSVVDSRTILDTAGAQNLIGRGDMLISTGNAITRVQCALVDTPEIERICDFIGEQHGYTEAFRLPEVVDDTSDRVQESNDGEFDPCFSDAARLIVETQQGSTSFLQRKFRLGYNRAGRIMDQLEREKIVGPAEGSKMREVYVKDKATLEEMLKNMNIS